MQIVLSLTPGGTERLVIEICRHLQDRVDSVVCCLDFEGAWAGEARALGIPVFALGRQPGFHPSLSLRIARLIKAHHIDVVHCHHYSPYVYGLLASLIAPARLVFTEHGSLSHGVPSPKRRLVNPLLTRRAGRLCAVSGFLRQNLIAEGFPADRLTVVHNGIEPGSRPTADERLAARAALGLPQEAFVVGTCARLVPVKSLPTLLQAHASVIARCPQARTVIIGEGPERAALEALTASLGLRDSVTFAGYRADVRAMVPGFDVYVNTSRYEGVSLTILEAMAAALPVVATRNGGNPEVVVDGETGFLVPDGAPGVADAISRLAADPARRRTMGDAGRRRLEQHFSLARMVEEYAAAYRGLPPALNAGYRDAHHLTPSAPAAVPATAHTTSVTEPTRSIV
jgi:glycosyltransferase involved in cell wall biosynthesis